jgi:hypothetical protein
VAGGNNPGWAYGTAGFGLVRLRAWELSPTAYHREEALAALAKTQRDLARPTAPVAYTLSAGRGGLAELLLAAAEPLADAALLAQARRVALAALRQRRQHGHYLTETGQPLRDPSLLNGQAGIGYFLLRTLAPSQIDSILLPRLPAAGFRPGVPALRGWPPPIPAVRKQVWGTHFQRTLCLLAQAAPAMVTGLFRDENFPANDSELLALQRRLHQLVRTVASPAKKVIREAFRLENCRLALLTRREGIAYRVAKQHVARGQALAGAQLTPAFFKVCSFRLGSHVRVLQAQWSWALTTPEAWPRNLTAPGSQCPLLLVSEADVVREFALGAFSAALLGALRRPATGGRLLAQLSRQLESDTDTDLLALTEAVMAQLKQLLAEGIVELRFPSG